MASNNGKVINVYLDSDNLGDTLFLGVLSITRSRGKELFTFEFTDDAIDCQSISTYLPGVQVGKGHYYLADEHTDNLYKLLMDSAPDRWGRILLRKKSLLSAKKATGNAAHRTLLESDYLLNIADVCRMGALRFQDSGNDGFLAANDKAIPPITELHTLEGICNKIEHDDEVDDWLEQLLAPGTSLGGARPKANVIETNEVLSIAKFPSKNDETDKGLWEYLTNALAGKAGINVPACKPVKLSSHFTTLLIERFDRCNGKRRHFVSAMALTQHNDGDEDASYFELVEFIKRYGRKPTVNLHELWRRIVFNIAVSNGDDHLRNHGFLLDNEGWDLAPAYDINPGSGSPGLLQLNINDTDNTADFEIALSCADQFVLSGDEARLILNEVYQALVQWPALAKQNGLSKSEIERMEPAFKIDELSKHKA